MFGALQSTIHSILIKTSLLLYKHLLLSIHCTLHRLILYNLNILPNFLFFVFQKCHDAGKIEWNYPVFLLNKLETKSYYFFLFYFYILRSKYNCFFKNVMTQAKKEWNYSVFLSNKLETDSYRLFLHLKSCTAESMKV